MATSTSTVQVQQYQSDDAEKVYQAAVLVEDVNMMCISVRVRWAFACGRPCEEADLEMVEAFAECVREMEG